MLGENKEVCIVGAGIAGLAAAIKLANEGFRVSVHERKTSIGSKFGYHVNAVKEYEVSWALKELKRLGLEYQPCTYIKRVIRIAPAASSETYGTSYVLFERGSGEYSLENQMYDLCVERCVKFCFRSKISPSAEGIDIVATGAPNDLRNILGVGYAYSMNKINLAMDELYLIYDNDIAPHGYVCLMPGPRDAMLLSVSFTEQNRMRLKKRLDVSLESGLLDSVLGKALAEKNIFGYGYVREDPILNAQKDGKLYVGESCGFQDARRGFGVDYALSTGIIAAQSIISGVPYRELLKYRYGSEFKDLWAARQRLNSLTNDDYNLMISSMGPKANINEYAKWKKESTLGSLPSNHNKN